MSGNVNIFHKYNYNNIFIETGSYHGKGIKWALEAGFKQIYSIEITPYYYNLCRSKFADYKNVEIILGDTVNILPGLLKSINGNSTLWLDAHYTDPSTEFGDKMCPLLDELEILKNEKIKTHTLLIDDLRCWSEADWNYKNYLFDNNDIIKKVLEINPEYLLSYDDGFIPDDVLVAQPKKEYGSR